MKWVSAVSENRLLQLAVAECAGEIENALDGETPDLTVAFVSVHHSQHYIELPGLMRELFKPHLFVGCSGGGIIGAGREVENRPGFSLAAAVLPDTKLVGFRIEDADLPDGDAPPSAWEDIATVAAADDPQFLLLSDPFSVRGEHLLMGFDYAFPRSAKIGGLASGGSALPAPTRSTSETRPTTTVWSASPCTATSRSTRSWPRAVDPSAGGCR